MSGGKEVKDIREQMGMNRRKFCDYFGIPELLKIANNKTYEENRKEKHERDAKFGWYSCDSKFALPVFTEEGDIKRYNVFHVALLVRHA